MLRRHFPIRIMYKTLYNLVKIIDAISSERLLVMFSFPKQKNCPPWCKWYVSGPYIILYCKISIYIFSIYTHFSSI